MRLRGGILWCLGLATFIPGCFTDPVGDPTARLRISSTCLTPADAERLEDQVLQLVNLERAGVGLPPVNPSVTLAGIANDYACRMVQAQFFSHRDPSDGQGPGERAESANYRFRSVGENLATGPVTAAEAMQLWMDSPSHRDNILDARWVEIGVAVRADEDGGLMWVQEFGEPLPASR